MVYYYKYFNHHYHFHQEDVQHVSLLDHNQLQTTSFHRVHLNKKYLTTSCGKIYGSFS